MASGAKCAGTPASVYVHTGHHFINWVDKTFPETMTLFSELQMWDNEFYANDAYKKDDPIWGRAAGKGMPDPLLLLGGGHEILAQLRARGERQQSGDAVAREGEGKSNRHGRSSIRTVNTSSGGM
jgi:hypothetical protein